MKGLENNTHLILYIISNIVAMVVLWAAWKRPRLARLLFFFIFTWASWTNWKTAIYTPEVYLGQADLSFVNFYKEFIQGWFSRHITETVCFIATCQAMIAVSMLLRGWVLKTGGIGAIVFLLAIAPLGVGSAFPCTVLLAVAMYRILRHPYRDYLWMSAKRKTIWQY